MMRRYRRVALAALGIVALAVPAVALGQPASGAQQAGITVVWGSFGSFSPGTAAVTYNPALVPFGAKASTLAVTGTQGTVITFVPTGLLPNREYGAHVHTRPCGASPADAGPHYQNVADPHQPSTDPAFANNRNEIWLDFGTDAYGNGFTLTTVNWGFTDRHAHSVVIHEHHTHTGDGQAGTAGARLACLNVNL
jgi:Cu-Zn family superoxide dismutase